MTAPYPGIKVNRTDLRAQADRIFGLSSGADEACWAASRASMDSDSYGVVCGFLPTAIINPLGESACDGIRSGVEMLISGVDLLRSAADLFEETERDSARKLGGD